jgi:hypothetical protein
MLDAKSRKNGHIHLNATRRSARAQRAVDCHWSGESGSARHRNINMIQGSSYYCYSGIRRVWVGKWPTCELIWARVFNLRIPRGNQEEEGLAALGTCASRRVRSG